MVVMAKYLNHLLQTESEKSSHLPILMPTEFNPADYLTRGLRVLDIEERWPRNKVPSASEQAKNEVKRKYLKTDQLCEARAQVITDTQSATLMALENSSNKMPW